jgi:hypothetical protein
MYFLAYFQILKKYAIVRTLSVCNATTFHGVDRSCSFMAQSIAYDPRAWTKEGIFFKTDPSPHGRGPKSKFHTFSYENKILLVFKKGYESDVGPGGEGVKSASRPK